MAKFVGAAEPLTRLGFRRIVEDLGVEVPALLAVLAVESKSCGFLPDRRPIILFERHIFHAKTKGKFSAANPDISNPVAGGYAGLAGEYPRLEKAAKLDRAAALQSASWGAGQVMGFNHVAAGFPDAESMVTAMQESEDAQISAMAAFLKSTRLAEFLKRKDWAGFAKGYNGAGFAKNKYDIKLAAAYLQYSSDGAIPDVEVRRAQLYLAYLGFNTGGIDGLHGKMSRAAVAQFRADNKVGAGDKVDKDVLAALQAKVKTL